MCLVLTLNLEHKFIQLFVSSKTESPFKSINWIKYKQESEVNEELYENQMKNPFNRNEYMRNELNLMNNK